MFVYTLRSRIANLYLLETDSGIVIVDTGFRSAGREVLRTIDQLGHAPRDVRLIFLTHVHMDHVGSAAEMKRVTGAPIALHHADAAKARAGKHTMPSGRSLGGKMIEFAFNRTGIEMKYERFEPDIFLQDGDRLDEIGLCARVLHTPGHTLGSLSLALDDGALFIGDAMINQVRVGMSLYGEDNELAYESLRRINALHPRIVYSGHGKPFAGEDITRYFEFKHLAQ